MPRAVPRPRIRRAPAAAGVAAATCLSLLAAFPACAPGPPGEAEAPCPSLPGVVHDRSTPWVFGLCENVDPSHVRSPRGDAEDTVFRYAYEGLTDVDCQGDLVPRLASSWNSADHDQVWTFELRGDATFDDGTPVTADDVLKAWRRARQDGHRLANLRWMWRDVILKQSQADGLRLTVHLRRANPDLPFLLAQPEFYVIRSRKGSWPLGTRGRVPRVRDIDGGEEITFAAGPGAPAADASPVVFRVLPHTDPRDAFGADTQALLTRDRRALRYLAAQDGVRLTPLPWSRRYALVDPTGDLAAVVDSLPALRAELARDVLPSVARAPWSPGPVAPDHAPSGPTGVFALRYRRGDPDGAALAERVASLATRQGGTDRWIVVPAPPASVRTGEAPAIVALPRFAFDPPPARRHAPDLELSGPSYPLADTRAHLVTRDDVAGVDFGWDGTPRLDRAGRTRKSDR